MRPISSSSPSPAFDAPGDELHEAIVAWTEHTYNRRRRQRALGKLTPVEYELAFTTQAADVAA